VIILDTNVVSALMRPEPSPAVVAWVESRDRTDLYTTSITMAEIRYGIERLPEGGRRELLATAAVELFTRFGEHVLPFDNGAAARYGKIVADRERAGTRISGFDAQVAAVCQAHNAVLATRNGKDFTGTGVEVVDPWQESRHAETQ
jgi:predicted nucleic acid-binding protein